MGWYLCGLSRGTSTVCAPVCRRAFADYFAALHADFFCLQETKLQPEQIAVDCPGYLQFWNSAEKKGYSGTAVFTKHPPLSVTYGVGIDELDHEGRMITLEYEKFYLVTCYTPNAQEGLKRIDHRLSWDDAFREKLLELDAKKPVIACGDLNVAHQEIDLKNPGPNRGNPGFSDEERGKLHKTSGRRLYRYLPLPESNAFAARTPGGATASTRAKRTRAGASTIFSSPTACSRQLRLHRSTTRFSARTIVRSVWN